MQSEFSRCKWIFLVLSLFLSSCVASEVPAASGAPALPACTPAEADANPYQRYDQTLVTAINSFYQLDTMQLGESLAKQNAQQKASKLLKEQVRTWSDHVDIAVDGGLIVRVTVTYVSPQLIESVVLNQTLYDPSQPINFDTYLQNTLNDIAKRDEYLFLVTLTASKYEQNFLLNSPLLVQMPVAGMVLTNSENLAVGPRHWDNHLSNSMNLRGESEHGYVGYQIGAEKDQTCHWLLDPTWNTTINLSVPHLYINGNDYGAQTWSIDYRTIIKVIDLDAELVTAPISTGAPAGNYSPVMTPPLVANKPLNEEQWADYWDVMSRFIWYHLTESIHH